MHINVIINNKEFKGFDGESILELCQRNGIEIPTLCHDPRLEPYSSCFLCVVEIDGIKGLQPACSTKIREGMKVQTENERVRKSRKMALDLIMSNHYADCAAPCKQRCPAGVDVQGYISLIEKGLYSEAVGLIKEVNPLPAICGRVCVRPCEVACRRNLLDEGAGVGIDYMKRFASDFDLKSKNHYVPKIEKSTGKRVAVIGAGPGGLSCGYFLQQKGHQVDIFEANPYAGGMLRYGIPEYRLPNNIIDQEVARITEIGVQIFYNKKLGDNLSYKDLKSKYDSIILTIGSQNGTSVGCEGDDADGVFSGIDFLRNMEMTGQKYDLKGKKVAVVGGGNTAMDCCRTSMRCGAEKTYIIYRRTEKEMPANPIEIHESKLEGIEYLFLTNPSKINKDENGHIKSMTLLRMELGEPDKSGRRRPVPIEGSEFEIELDMVLAAIGQKTNVDFIYDINQNADGEELKITRWGDIEADKNTLQTGIKSVFAAGDGVTGPATLIEAIAQAKIASRSCHQFLLNLPIEADKQEFLSKKDNFKTQKPEEYTEKWAKQLRIEMPVLEPNVRQNFNEVELGYSEKEAITETARCFECGCTEYFTCDLKKYATEYNSEQKRFEGDFKEFKVDFSHPYIEIDNNKCILCARCVRICSDVVGANALGLVNRGFDTFVAPSMGDSLTETSCESCGLCISTCPTGAITENVTFKPGPVKLESFNTISNYDSVGSEITIHHKSGFVMKVTGANGLVNKNGNFSKSDKFGYKFYNNPDRIILPLIKDKGKFVQISFDEAYEIIEQKIKSVKSEENAFFAGARLTNEEIYLIKKLSKQAVKTNNFGSFSYLNRGDGYVNNSVANVPFEDISGASRIYILGSEIHEDAPVVGFIINYAKKHKNIPITYITTNKESKLEDKVNQKIKVESYYHFVKAVNNYMLKTFKENQLFIDDNCLDFTQYKYSVIEENYIELVNLAGVDIEDIKFFAEDYNNELNAIIVFSEKNISSNTSKELFNLAMLTGKLGKTSNGLISLKEKNNSHGLIDAEISENIDIDGIKNFFIFGEDPIGCATDNSMAKDVLNKAEFTVVQDYFMTETAKKADLILPASFHIEIGGTFTNTQKVIQQFEAQEKFSKRKPEKHSFEQLIAILEKFGLNGLKTIGDIQTERFENHPKQSEKLKFAFEYTENDNHNRLFDYGCDILEKMFAEEFCKAFE